MGKLGMRALVLLATALAMLAIAACGDDDDDGGGGGDTGGQTGGTLNIAHTSYPDFLDPALSYTVDGWEALHLAYPGLVTYSNEEGAAGAEVVPGLAEDLPTISEDGKTYKFTLREGLKYSDGTPVKASDFKDSIERVLEQDSQGAGLGYTSIEGGEEFLKTKKGGVTGIETERRRRGDDQDHALRAARRVPVRAGDPVRGRRAGRHAGEEPDEEPAPGRGPLHDPATCRSTAATRWSRTRTSRPPEGHGGRCGQGRPDRRRRSTARSRTRSRRSSRGDLDFMVDNPPPDRVGGAEGQVQRTAIEQFATHSTFYFFMNAEAPPFDNLKVRQAVNYAIDPDAINRVQGGVIAPAHTSRCRRASRATRTRRGPVPVRPGEGEEPDQGGGRRGRGGHGLGNPESPTKQTVEYYADVLNQIGLDAEVKIIAADDVLRDDRGPRQTKAQTGWANWFQDYPHPSDFIDVLLNPDNVVATGNNNYTYNAGDKELARKINAADGRARADRRGQEAWARDRPRGPGEGVLGPSTATASSRPSSRSAWTSRTARATHYAVGTHDWAQFCLK